MRVAIVVEVDDDLLAAHVERSYAEFDQDAPERLRPDEWLIGRLQDVADDELRVALYGWEPQLGMEVTVERRDD